MPARESPCPRAKRSGCRATMGVMIGRLHHVVIDCPAPRELAAFYSELVGLPVTYDSDDWVVVSQDEVSSGIAFQLARDWVAPRWPDPAHPQQFHVDVMVDDIPAADRAVVALGATRLDAGAEEWRVYSDPAGHPFCLVPRPGWAAAIGGPLE